MFPSSVPPRLQQTLVGWKGLCQCSQGAIVSGFNVPRDHPSLWTSNNPGNHPISGTANPGNKEPREHGVDPHRNPVVTQWFSSHCVLWTCFAIPITSAGSALGYEVIDNIHWNEWLTTPYSTWRLEQDNRSIQRHGYQTKPSKWLRVRTVHSCLNESHNFQKLTYPGTPELPPPFDSTLYHFFMVFSNFCGSAPLTSSSLAPLLRNTNVGIALIL